MATIPNPFTISATTPNTGTQTSTPATTGSSVQPQPVGVRAVQPVTPTTQNVLPKPQAAPVSSQSAVDTSSLDSNQLSHYNQLISAGASPSSAFTAANLIPKTTTPQSSGSQQTSSQNTSTFNPQTQGTYTSGVGSTNVYTPSQNAQAVQPVTVTNGTLGTGSPSSLGTTQTPTGIIGNLIAQAQQNVQNVQKQFQPIIDYNTGIINNVQAEENAIAGGSFQGSQSDYAGRLSQLESLKQNAQQNINNAQTNIQNAINSGQTGYNSALGAVTNFQQAPYGTPLFNPVTGTYTSSAGTLGQSTTGGTTITGNPQQDATTLAKLVINQQIPYSDAVNSMSYAGNIGTGLLQTAITSLGGNLTQIEAQTSATQQNIATQQEAEINALSSTYGQNAPQAFSLNNDLNNIASLGQLALTNESGANINPLTFAPANQTIASFRNLLSSPSQAAFDSNMANFQAALTGIYSDTSGAVPTQVSQWGTEIANGTMPLATLQSVYEQAINEGNARLNNLKQTVGSSFSGLQSVNPSTGTTSNGSTSLSDMFPGLNS